MDVEFRGLRYAVKTKRREKKEILHGVTGWARAGEMLAVMGPSGSGKTSLLNVVAGVMSRGVTGGEVLYGGCKLDKQSKRNIGYVTQEDLMFQNLTVEETLMFTAKLRLPKTATMEERKKRVEEVMSYVKLTKARNTLIGDGLHHKGISGGERKRLSIAIEILVDPKVLILDEPTTGLDSSTALTTVTTLKQLASEGKTVILTIHQPSSQIYALFDKILFLCEGDTVYFGPRQGVINFFAKAGFDCPFGYNPADYFMGLLSGDDQAHAEDSSDDQITSRLKTQWKTLSETPLSSTLSTDSDGAKYGEKEQRCEDAEVFRVPWWTQFCILFGRSWKQNHGEMFDRVDLFKLFSITLTFCLVYFRMSWSESSLRDRIGCINFITVYWAMATVLAATYTFASEYKVIRKERTSGSYRLSAYFCAKSIVDVPVKIAYPLVFSIIVYWVTGLNPSFARFMIFVVVLLCHTLLAQSVGLTASTATLNVRKAVVLAFIFTLSSVLLTGYYANTNNLPAILRVLQYFSFIRYSFSALLINETSGVEYPCDATQPTPFRVDGCPIQQEAILKIMPITDIGVGGNLAVMLALTVLFRLLSFLFLYILCRKDKKKL